MSIPLDRLYDHLYNICNRDIIIYRWLVHGSKKLEDLNYLHQHKSPKKILTTPIAIMHDQEPLQFDLWSAIDYHRRRMQKGYVNNNDINDPWLDKLGLRNAVARANFYDRTLIVHSERNSDQVKIYQDNGFEPVYYWSHAIIALDWFRYAKHDSVLKFNIKNIKTDFLIYNRAWCGTREYRLKFINLLINQGLHPYCQTSFKTVDNGIHYTAHKFKNPLLSIDRNDIETLIPENNHLSCASADYNSLDYTTSAIEVVLETLFDDTRNHLTEKTLRPIAVGKPFILVSTPGSLKYLRSYGFKTFDGLINEDYDNINDPLERLKFIINEMQRIRNLPLNEKFQLWKDLHAIADYNKKLFFSENFINSIEQELKENLDHALDKLKNYRTGYYWTNSPIYYLYTKKEIKLYNQWLKEFQETEVISFEIDPSHSDGNSDCLSS